MPDTQPVPYRPKSDHPWRNYSNRFIPKEDDAETKTPKKHIKPLKEWMTDMVDAWDNIELDVDTSFGIQRKSLSEVTDKRAANFLMGIMKAYVD